MPYEEIEVKFLIDDLPTMRQRVLAMGATLKTPRAVLLPKPVSGGIAFIFSRSAASSFFASSGLPELASAMPRAKLRYAPVMRILASGCLYFRMSSQR